MKQSKKHSHYEIIANSATGIILGWMIVFFIFPMIGVATNAQQASISTVIFFVVSYTRAYIIRRIFNTL